VTGWERLSQNVEVGDIGIVREWHGEEGWGVIDIEGAPGGCWTHITHLDMEGYRGLHAGQRVELTFNDQGQVGFPYRAIRVLVPGVPPAKAFEGNDPSDAYGSHVTLHFDE
jgi:cold shock protein